jgi:hypothetical protein
MATGKNGYGAMIPRLKELQGLLNVTLEERDRDAIIKWEKQRTDVLRKMTDHPLTEPTRWRLPDERKSITHHFEIGTQCENGCDDHAGVSGYITCGLYSNFQLGEIFVVMNKQGSFVSGMTDAFVTSLSIALQHGIPLNVFTSKFSYTRFEPSGMVVGAPCQELKMAKSVLDYIARWLERKFPNGKLVEEDRCERCMDKTKMLEGSVEMDTETQNGEMSKT